MENNESSNPTKDLKLYSVKAISLASYLGAPMAALYLARHNYRQLGEPQKGNTTFLVGIIATLGLFAILFSIPESIIDKIPNYIIPATYTAIIYFWANRKFGSVLDAHKEQGYTLESIWKGVGLSLASLAIIVLLLLGISFLVFPQYYNDAPQEYVDIMDKFYDNEETSLTFYDHLETESDRALIKELDEIAIPLWEENRQLVLKAGQVEGLDEYTKKENAILLRYTQLRLKNFQTFKSAILSGNESYIEKLDEQDIQIAEVLEELGNL